MAAVGRSQHGEDVYLASLFNQRRGGVYVEAGALDGERLSNSWLFEMEFGWTGVLVEPNPILAEACRINRPKSQVLEAALGRKSGTIQLTIPGDDPAFATTKGSDNLALRHDSQDVEHITVQLVTLDEALESLGVSAVDLVVLDVEDSEHLVMAGFSIDRFNPSVIMLERERLYASVLFRLIRARYGFDARIVTNDVWIRRDSLLDALATVPSLLRVAVGPTVRAIIRQSLQRLRLLDALRRRRGSLRE